MIKKGEHYDVFISYRRKTGVNDARLLQQALRSRGYKVFFDFDSLRDGKFDERILRAIDKAPVFILMLTANSLDKCINQDDWVRLEIEHALSKGRKIIPIQPSDQFFDFPNILPSDIKPLVKEQISELNKAALFEESITKIIQDRFPPELKYGHISSRVESSVGDSGEDIAIRARLPLAKMGFLAPMSLLPPYLTVLLFIPGVNLVALLVICILSLQRKMGVAALAGSLKFDGYTLRFTPGIGRFLTPLTPVERINAKAKEFAIKEIEEVRMEKVRVGFAKCAAIDICVKGASSRFIVESQIVAEEFVDFVDVAVNNA